MGKLWFLVVFFICDFEAFSRNRFVELLRPLPSHSHHPGSPSIPCSLSNLPSTLYKVDKPVWPFGSRLITGLPIPPFRNHLIRQTHCISTPAHPSSNNQVLVPHSPTPRSPYWQAPSSILSRGKLNPSFKAPKMILDSLVDLASRLPTSPSGVVAQAKANSTVFIIVSVAFSAVAWTIFRLIFLRKKHDLPVYRVTTNDVVGVLEKAQSEVSSYHFFHFDI